jgi:hypothetical protein
MEPEEFPVTPPKGTGRVRGTESSRSFLSLLVQIPQISRLLLALCGGREQRAAAHLPPCARRDADGEQREQPTRSFIMSVTPVALTK